MTIAYEAAEELAVRAHGGSRMKSGSLFIEHVRRVAAHFDPVADGDAAVAALLHDTVEKGSLEFDDLRRAGVDEHIIAVVDALTERDDEPEHEYLSRCVALPLALRIKRVDISDKLAVQLHADVDSATVTVMQVNASRRLALLEELASGPTDPARTPPHQHRH